MKEAITRMKNLSIGNYQNEDTTLREIAAIVAKLVHKGDDFTSADITTGLNQCSFASRLIYEILCRYQEQLRDLVKTLNEDQIKTVIAECSDEFNKKNTPDDQAIADALSETKLFNALCIMQEDSWKDRFDNKAISIEFKYGSKEELHKFELRWDAAGIVTKPCAEVIPTALMDILKNNFSRFQKYLSYREGLKKIAGSQSSELRQLFRRGVDYYFPGDISSIQTFADQLCEVWLQDGEKKRSAEELYAVFQHFAKEVKTLRNQFEEFAECVWHTSWYIVSIAKKVSQGSEEEWDKKILSHASFTRDKNGNVTVRNKFTNEEIKSAYFTPKVLQFYTDAEREKQLNNLYKVLAYGAAVVAAIFSATCFLSAGFRGAVFSGLSPIVSRFCNASAKGGEINR